MKPNKNDKRFHFRRFSMAHDRCGMKIGTDGVLLGSWANVDGCKSILDIGTGCGLIAVMMAQRTENRDVQIVGVEVEESAAAQATQNVADSPWPAPITIVHSSIQKFAQRNENERVFDLITCNPAIL